MRRGGLPEGDLGPLLRPFLHRTPRPHQDTARGGAGAGARRRPLRQGPHRALGRPHPARPQRRGAVRPPRSDPLNDDWRIYEGTGSPHDGIDRLPPALSWRRFEGEVPGDAVPPPEWRPGDRERARHFLPNQTTVDLTNAALYLRRPLLVTGQAGVGKSTLALSIAHELGLGPVLRWPITSRSSLKQGLYTYDAIGRLHDVNLREQAAQSDIGRYLTLGPLGTALLPRERPRVLLIDEIDKSDIDLPNDLLTIFEEGEFDIPELVRVAPDRPRVQVTTADGAGRRVSVSGGRVRCAAFPVIVLTSNGEREFPPAFLRRCVPLTISPPTREQLANIVRARLGEEMENTGEDLLARFVERQQNGRELATDQLLNAVYFRFEAARRQGTCIEDVAEKLIEHLRTATD
ncbi:AAA domain-containing protein [Actinomadura sp. NEAU-AAG5]|uniref:AAA domain-containing protein n=1 Tax=Actinomadura litoris TaxID=2678616 RepID=A0A7K1L215_9ACTN|nr:AAA domain-containing protein [Actinomadura litoris]